MALGTTGVIGAATGIGVATRECVEVLGALGLLLELSAAHAVDAASRTANTPMPARRALHIPPPQDVATADRDDERRHHDRKFIGSVLFVDASQEGQPASV